MQASVKHFWLPKHGNTTQEYEDAASYSTHRFAIADGATESSFSDLWARSLVQEFVSRPPRPIRSNMPLEEWLKPLQKKWHGGIPWERLPWYAEEKARAGAFTTFLGVEISPAPARFRWLDWLRRRKGTRWQALSVGDSCFFHLRKGALASGFPFQRAEQFNNRPLLVSSNPKRNGAVWKSIRIAEGDCQPGDVFLLMTDALGHWALREKESGAEPWTRLLKIESEQEFADFVECERKKSAMRNDDTTLLVCCWRETIS